MERGGGWGRGCEGGGGGALLSVQHISMYGLHTGRGNELLAPETEHLVRLAVINWRRIGDGRIN